MITIKSCSLFLAFVLIYFQGLTMADQRQKVIDFHAECLDVHGVEEDALIEALEGQPREDEAFYHHMFCAARKAKIMSDDGTVNIKNFKVDMKDVVEPENMDKVYEILEKCLVQREDIMTTVRNAVHCFMVEDHGL